MAPFADAVKNFYRGYACFALGNAAAAYGLAGRLFPGASAVSRFAKGLRRQICSDDPSNDLPPLPPLLEGGQCAVDYQVFTTLISVTGANLGETFSGVFMGPFTYVFTGIAPPTCSDPSFPVRRPIQFLRIGDGTEILQTGNACATQRKAYIFRFVRSDGLPDNCGNQEDEPPVPPGPVSFGDNITYNIDDSTEITVPITGVFAPIYVALDGTIKADVDFDVGGVEFSGELTFSPEFDFEFKPRDTPTPTPNPDDPDLPPTDNPGDDEPIDDEPAKEKIIGVQVRVNSIGNNNVTDIFQAGAPNILVPRAANVTFGVRTGRVTGWTTDQPVKMVSAYIPCPVDFGADEVRVTPEPGFEVEFTPVRGKPIAQFEP